MKLFKNWNSNYQFAPNFPEWEFRSGPRLLRRFAAPLEEPYLGRARQLSRALQKVRDILGYPIIVTSGFRTEEYNKKVGGVHTSWHTHGWAADIACANATPETIAEVILELKRMHEVAVGELGIYVKKGFVHWSLRGRGNIWTVD